MTLDELLDEWEIDSHIDETDIGGELLKIPQLHSKYLSILSHHNLVLKKLTYKYNVLRKTKWEYYKGDLNNPEDLKEYNLQPFIKKLDNRQDILLYLEADQDLVNINLKKSYQQEIIDTCTLIIKELNSRTYQLKSFIDHEKFINGIN